MIYIGVAYASHVLLLPVSFVEHGKPCECFFASTHRFAEDHEKTADDRKVTQEEIQIEDEPVTKPLNNNNTEETSDSEFSISFLDGEKGTPQHDLEKVRM